MKTVRLSAWIVCVVSLWLATFTRAQTATGIISGRVKNAVTGDYLNNARISVKGSSLLAFSDDNGSYVIEHVPAGPVTLRTFFTGLDEQETTVNVTAGQTLTLDFGMTSKARYGDTATTVKLDAYVVASTKETNAAAIAV